MKKAYHRFANVGMANARIGVSARAALALALATLPMAASKALAAPPSPVGLWATRDDESVIEIAPCGNHFCGTLVWLKEPNEADGSPKLDVLNEDESMRGRPMLGMTLLIDLASEKSYWRGKAYNPEDGKTYDITFKLLPSKGQVEKAEVEGCVLKILCSSETFTRVNAIPGMPPAPASQPSGKTPASSKTPSAKP